RRTTSILSARKLNRLRSSSPGVSSILTSCPSRKSQSCARRLPNSLIKSISTQGHPPEIGVLHGSGSHAAPVHLRDERTITKTNAAQEIDARGDGCRCCGSWLVFEISRARAPGGLG